MTKYQKRLIGFTVFWVAFWFTVLFGVAMCSPANAASADVDWNIIPPDEMHVPTIDKCVVGGEELSVLRKQVQKHYYYTYSIGGWYSQYEYWDVRSAEKGAKDFCRVYKSMYEAMM